MITTRKYMEVNYPQISYKQKVSKMIILPKVIFVITCSACAMVLTLKLFCKLSQVTMNVELPINSYILEDKHIFWTQTIPFISPQIR